MPRLPSAGFAAVVASLSLFSLAGEARAEDFAARAREHAARGHCLTDVRGSLQALEARARAQPLPEPLRPLTPKGAPSPRLRALRHGAGPLGITVIDGQCHAGGCPVQYASEYAGHPFYEVDTHASAAAFFNDFPDTADSGWDVVVFFTTFFTTSAGGAYYRPVANDVSGIMRTYVQTVIGGGGEVYNYNRWANTGSAGFLKGTVLMSEWHMCRAARAFGIPCDNTPPFDESQSNLIGILGQEVGHRWGAFLHFRDGNRNSDELLGRDVAHWSYYADSDGSPLEGNRWALQGDRWALQKVTSSVFSPLDRYAMGILPRGEVAPTLLLTSPFPAPCTTNKTDSQVYARCRTNASTGPGEGATLLSASPRQVTIDEVIAAEGERRPAFPDAPRVVHLAFVLIELSTAKASETEQRVLNEVRRGFTRFFYESTGRRMRAITTLSRRDDLAVWDFLLDEEGWRTEGSVPTNPKPGVAVLGTASSEVRFVHRHLELNATQEKYAHIRLTARGDFADRAQLGFIRGNDEPGVPVALPLVGDGRTRTLLVPMEGREGWGPDDIHGLSLTFPPARGGRAGVIEIDSIEFAAEPKGSDADSDLIVDEDDNCPGTYNPDQADTDGDGRGNACTPKPPEDDGSGGDAVPVGGCAGCGSSSLAYSGLLFFGLALRPRRWRRGA